MPRALLITCIWLALTAAADAAEPIVYTLSFADAQNSYVDVEARLPIEGRTELEVMMAVWTPGSYLVREYARHVEQVRAESETGQALQLVKTRKNRWRISALGGASAVVLRYKVYGREMSVRTNWVERDFALINGAPTFVTLADDPGPRPHEIHIRRPEGWSAAHTALPPVEGEADRFRAPDYDTLVDSPILLGSPRTAQFEVGGKPHLLVDDGGGDVWNTEQAAADVQRIIETQQAFWGSVPYDRYTILNVIHEARGGLEHLSSTVVMASRWHQRLRPRYLQWLRLVSHEYFHTWNVKRLRPVELGPFDYERENHTRSLWIAEGVTSYYDALLLHRSGLSTVDEYLGMLSDRVQAVQRTPGRAIRSLELASFDAWIRYYRRDENSVNTDMSYYDKGAAVAWLLDARIRAATRGKKSLDDVMRAAYDRFSGERGFRTEAFYALASEIAGVDLGPWFEAHAGGTDELDYGPALKWLGLRFAPSEEAPDRGWLGIDTAYSGGRLRVAEVLRGGPAWQAGVNPDDELVAIEGYRLGPDLGERLRQYRPGTRVELLVSRRQRMVTLPVVLGPPPTAPVIEFDPDASKVAAGRRAAWLATPEADPKRSNK